MLGDKVYSSEYAALTTFKPNAPGFFSAVRETPCGPQGTFKFDKVADGEYFVHTLVTWTVGYNSLQGGRLTKLVQVKNGEAVEVVLAP